MITADEFFTAKAQKQQPKKTAAHHHNVYVIELDVKVLKDRKFRAANPDHDPKKPCLYVGSTGLSPYERFLNHKDCYKSNRYAEKYGMHLRPDLFAVYNPMPYKAAVELEVELADGLRAEGYAVWQA